MQLRRGCGYRKPGAAYAVTEVSDHGIPWVQLLVDPVLPIDPEEIGLASQGILAIDRPDGLVDLWDWVGAGRSPSDDGYWNPADFIEEGLRWGFSTLIPKPVLEHNRGRITSDSRMFKVHPNAYLLNPEDYWADRRKPCLTQNPEHDHGQILGITCISMLWESIEGGEEGDNREVIRAFPPKSPRPFNYAGWRPPTTPRYAPGAFMWLPISRFDVIYDGMDGTHEKALDLLDKLGGDLPYQLVEE